MPLGLCAQTDSLRVDTLQEVVVTPNYSIPEFISTFLRESTLIGNRRTLLPEGFHDRVTHPFAIKARKQERHRKKMKKILREYEMLKTPNEELIEALKREGLYEELEESSGGK